MCTFGKGTCENDSYNSKDENRSHLKIKIKLKLENYIKIIIILNFPK